MPAIVGVDSSSQAKLTPGPKTQAASLWHDISHCRGVWGWPAVLQPSGSWALPAASSLLVQPSEAFWYPGHAARRRIQQQERNQSGHVTRDCLYLYRHSWCAGGMIQYCVHGRLVCRKSHSVSIQLVSPPVCTSSCLENGPLTMLGVWINHITESQKHFGWRRTYDH